VTSVDQKPLTGDQANEFAKRQVRVDIGRKGAEDISKAALADSKFEGDYARIMAISAPAGAAPAGPAEGTTPSQTMENPAGAAPAAETPAGESQKEQLKN
jgi:hypothetical protein